MNKTKTRVLIVDDETHIRELIKAVFNSMNCEIVGEAENGNDAIELYEKLNPDILMLDINMPFKNGCDTLKEIRISDPDAFIIMLTSVAELEDVNMCIEAGASSYIRKDTSIEELKMIIKKAWKEHKSI